VRIEKPLLLLLLLLASQLALTLKYFSGDQVKGKETGGACGSSGGREGAREVFWRVKSEGKCFRDLDVNGRIM